MVTHEQQKLIIHLFIINDLWNAETVLSYFDNHEIKETLSKIPMELILETAREWAKEANEIIGYKVF